MKPGALNQLQSAIEQEAERVATLELERKRAFLGSLGSAEREAITRIASRVAGKLAASLAAEADADDRLSHALLMIYLPKTPDPRGLRGA